jgi:hypothetical protein
MTDFDKLIDDLILCAKDYVYAHGNHGHVEKLLAARSDLQNAIQSELEAARVHIYGLRNNLKEWEEKYYSMTKSNGKSVQANAELLEINRNQSRRITELETKLAQANK